MIKSHLVGEAYFEEGKFEDASHVYRELMKSNANLEPDLILDITSRMGKCLQANTLTVHFYW
jgi:pentatricopeptide repeat protein